MTRLLLLFALQDPSFATAESLLAAGRPNEALPLARELVHRRPTDARARLLVGRVHYARPVVGRYAALDAFRIAARLAPADPEPRYRQAEVGFFLGSDEGDGIAREALLELFALVPDYRDAWSLFGRLYRDHGISRRADRAFARHGADAVSLERRAVLALARGELAVADSLAGLVLDQRRGHVPALLLRARAAFEAERDAAGYAWHDSVLAGADRDSTGALWETVWMIAAPAEDARHAATPPGERRAFFEWFWASRDPNLVSAENERIAEHFRRLAEARRRFGLAHPLNLFHRSAAYRALTAGGAVEVLRGQLEPAATARDPAARPTLDLGGTAGASGTTAFARAGLDARGLLWVRHGPPDERHFRVVEPLRPIEAGTVSTFDLEGWLYRTPDGPLTIALARGSAGLQGGSFGGDFIFLPVSARQESSARRLLATDRSALPAPRAAAVWSATFRSAVPGLTDVYFRTPPGVAAAVLWDATGTAVVRDSGHGLLGLAVPPGGYRLGLDIDSAGVLARLRADVVLPRYGIADLGLSSLVLAPGDSVGIRRAVLEASPEDLAFAPGQPLACYAEIYGLASDADGGAQYTVRYTFAPIVPWPKRLLGGGEPVVFEFTREAPAAPVVPERLVLDPGQVRAGRYRVTLAVTDRLRNVKSESVALEITLR